MNRQKHTFVTTTQTHRDLIAVTIILLLLAVNSLGEKSDATPAVADERMYLRTTSHLICLGGTAK